MSSIDDVNYYDIDGEKICDKEGKCNILDIESNDTLENEYEQRIENNPVLSSIVYMLYCFSILIQKMCDCIHDYKNRDI